MYKCSVRGWGKRHVAPLVDINFHISCFFMLNSMTYEGQMKKLINKFRIKLVVGGG